MASRTRAWIKANFMQRDPNELFVDLIDSLAVGILRHTGSLFYVDPSNGSDSNGGQSPDDAYATMQTAIDACAADNSDVIVVMPGNHDVTTAVNINKSGLTIVASELGLPPAAQGEKFTINAAASYTDGPAAIITDPCRIIGLGFAGRDLTQESLLIDCEEAGGFSGGFIELRNCRFSAWYGAIDAGIRTIGGALNHIVECTFDGLFGGFGTAAIIMENDTGGFAPSFVRVVGNYFSGVGTGSHAIKHATGSVPADVLYAHNYLLPGFSGNAGKFLDNTNVASTGLAADNWLAPLVNQGAAFENMTNSSIGFADNHYEEA